MLQSCSWGSVHKHQPQQSMMAEPLISLSSSKTWLKPPKHPKLNTDLCNVPKSNPAALYPVVSAPVVTSWTSSCCAATALEKPAFSQGELQGREPGGGEGRHSITPPSPMLCVPTELQATLLDMVVITF